MKYLLFILMPLLILSCGVEAQDGLDEAAFKGQEKEFLESLNDNARSAPQPEVVALNNQIHLITLGLGTYMEGITDCSNRPATIADFDLIDAITDQLEVLNDSIGTIATGRNLMIHNFYNTYLQNQFNGIHQHVASAMVLLNSTESCAEIKNRLINGRLQLVKNDHGRLVYASNTKKRLYR